MDCSKSTVCRLDSISFSEPIVYNARRIRAWVLCGFSGFISLALFAVATPAHADLWQLTLPDAPANNDGVVLYFTDTGTLSDLATTIPANITSEVLTPPQGGDNNWEIQIDWTSGALPTGDSLVVSFAAPASPAP